MKSPAILALFVGLCIVSVAAAQDTAEHRANIEEAIKTRLEREHRPLVAAAMPVENISSESSTHFTVTGVNGVDYALNLPRGVWDVRVSLSGASDYLALWSDNRHWRRATECDPHTREGGSLCLDLLYDDSDRLAHYQHQDDYHVGTNLVWHNFYSGAATISTSYDRRDSNFTVTFRRIRDLPAPPFTCSEAESRGNPAPNPEPTPPGDDAPPCQAAGEGVNLDGHQVFMCIVASGEVHQLSAVPLSPKAAVFGSRNDPKAVVKLVGGCTWGAVAAVTTARKLQIRVYNPSNGREWKHNHNRSGLAPSGYSGDQLCDP